MTVKACWKYGCECRVFTPDGKRPDALGARHRRAHRGGERATSAQEALAQALRGADFDPEAWPTDATLHAAAIIDALPEGWALADATTGILNQMHRCGEQCGAQQERERLRALFADFPPDYMLTAASVLKRLADPEDDR